MLLVLVSAFCILQLRTRPYLAVGWFWFLGMLVPVIGLVQVGEQAMAESLHLSAPDRSGDFPGLLVE
jgi:hypothetical protein